MGGVVQPSFMKPKKVRHHYVTQKAEQLYKEFNLKNPPFPIREILTAYNTEIHHVEIKKPIIILHGNKYIILPGDTYFPNNWTLIQQFAHIYLGHFEEFTVDKLNRSLIEENLTNEEIDILTQEADLFAHEFLLPRKWVLNNLTSRPTENQINFAVKTAGVPREIIKERLRKIHVAS